MDWEEREAVTRSTRSAKGPSTRYPTDGHLIAGIRRGEEPAMKELFLLYSPLLRDQAKKMSVPAEDRESLVETLLDDVVIRLLEAEAPPRDLSRYLISALRNRARTRHRNEQRHRAVDESAYAQYGDSGERIVAECHSQYGMDAARSLDAEGQPNLRSAIVMLAEKFVHELSQEEIIMMVGVGRHVALRDLAEQLGVSYGAARVRLSRVRERFIKLAILYVASLDGPQKNEIRRFFRRADVRLDENRERDDSNVRSTREPKGISPPEPV